ncbi:MAG: hypothetical protein ACOYB3_11515 [Azonexus sp.]
MATPTEIILDHLEAVRDAFAQAGGPVAAWNLLRDTCPAIAENMALNSFRTTAPPILGTVARLSVPPPPPPVAPRSFLFWTVATDRHGYLRLHRRIGGKVRTLYIGRQWDEAKAREKIAARTAAAPLGTAS